MKVTNATIANSLRQYAAVPAVVEREDQFKVTVSGPSYCCRYSKNDGAPVSSDILESVQQELAEKFGGLTVYSRAPAEGTWQNNSRKIEDELLLFEVMVSEQPDRTWWRQYRSELEDRFRQKEILIRSFAVGQL